MDLDNTIINYDGLLRALAVERGLLSEVERPGKKQIRDRIRALSDGETEWQKLQAVAYGQEIGRAELSVGVIEFFQHCARRGVSAYIVSHKTQYSVLDDTRTDLRQSALAWMRAHRFFDQGGLALSPEAVFFEATRSEKVARIGRLCCTHFIDDLEETFRERTFPYGVRRILLVPEAAAVDSQDLIVASSWRRVGELVFGDDIGLPSSGDAGGRSCR